MLKRTAYQINCSVDNAFLIISKVLFPGLHAVRGLSEF
jgi:hypothetical protein